MKYVLLSLLLLATTYMASIEGKQSAIRIIEGTSDDSIAIEFVLRNEMSSITNRRLMLVMETSDAFYVIERQSPAPQSPVMYVVPRSNVESAAMQRVSE